MASVTFRDGVVISDDANPNTGLANGGHRLRFVPALQEVVSVALEAQGWASVTGEIIFDGEYSAKEYAVGSLTTQTGGSAKQWANKPDSQTVIPNEYSAKAHAIGSVIPTGSAKDWAVKADSSTVITGEYSAKAHAIGELIPTGSAKDWASGNRIISGFKSARVYAEEASDSAFTALNAPSTASTSLTSNDIPTVFPATRTFITQTDKLYVAGMFVIAANTPTPSNYIIGQVTTYDSLTGSLTIYIASASQVNGTGTFADWTISLTALADVAGAALLSEPNTFSNNNTFQGNVIVQQNFTYQQEVLTSSVSSLQVPVGATLQRPTGVNGKIRYNTDLNRYEGYSSVLSSWAQLGGGATGGGADQVFYENDNVVTQDYTISTNKNAMTAGPITISDGVSVTVPDGSSWTIV